MVSSGSQVHSDDATCPHASVQMQRRSTGPGSRGPGCTSQQYVIVAFLVGVADDVELSRITAFCRAGPASGGTEIGKSGRARMFLRPSDEGMNQRHSPHPSAGDGAKDLSLVLQGHSEDLPAKIL